MRLFFRRPVTSRAASPPPNPLTVALTSWIDRLKHRLSAALSRMEQQMSIKQKKYALILFLALGTGLFSFTLYQGLVHRRPFNPKQQHIRMPAALPDHSQPALARPRMDSATTLNHLDSLPTH